MAALMLLISFLAPTADMRFPIRFPISHCRDNRTSICYYKSLRGHPACAENQSERMRCPYESKGIERAAPQVST